jgi:uncharacterized protein (TIRG00374 family)
MKWKKILPFIGLILFVYILIKYDFVTVIKEIANANLVFILISFIFLFFFLLTQTLKWFVIARYQKTKVPFFEAFKINLMASFYGNVTPSRVGNVIRSEYLKKYNKDIGKGLSNFTLDKVLDICSLVFLAGLFSFAFKHLIPIDFLTYSLILFIVLVACLIIFIEEKRSKKILRIFYKMLIPEKFKQKAKNIFNSFYSDMPKKRYFLLFFILNLLNWIVLYTANYFIGLSVGVNVPFYWFLAIFPIATFVAQIPITIAGLGTREATLIALFGLFGVAATKVISISLISILIFGIVPAIIGIFLILKNKEN